jgi:hypothetical protein
MELAAKFKMISDNNKIAEIARPIEVEFEKPYPILGAFRHLYLGSNPFITLSIQITDDDAEDFRVGHCNLSPAYSRVFDNNDISELNANAGKYKLIYRKKNCCSDYCYFFVIET